MGVDVVVAVIAALGALLAVWVAQRLTDQTEHRRTQIERRLEAGAEILGAVPEISRSLTNYAYLPLEQKADRSSAVITRYHESAIRWNGALAKGLAVLLPHQSSFLLEMDREVDRLLDLANFRQWERLEFRPKRERLGELALDLINDLRNSADLGRLETHSIWSWAEEPVGGGQ